LHRTKDILIDVELRYLNKQIVKDVNERINKTLINVKNLNLIS